MKDYIIERMEATDWNRVCSIYKAGIATGNSTFQVESPSWEEWDKGHSATCRLVMKANDLVIGWAALSNVSSRYVYRGVAEVSIYMSEDHSGKGLGAKLLEALIKLSEENGYWTLQAGIFPENAASLKIHKKCGFREVGYRERLGQMHTGEWRNIMFLERRSEKI